MRSVLSLFFVFSFFNIVGQSNSILIYQGDTLWETELVGETRVREKSWKNTSAKSKGVDFIEFESSECKGYYLIKERDLLLDYIEIKDTVIVTIGVFEPCCLHFLGELELIDDKILNLIYFPFGEVCECFCGYHLKYKFLNSNEREFTFQINDSSVELEKLNLKEDLYGYLIGNFYEIEKSALVNANFRKVENLNDTIFTFFLVFDEKDMSQDRDCFTSRYYSNGRIHSYEKMMINYSDTIDCKYIKIEKEWDRDGNITKDETITYGKIKKQNQ